MRLVVMGTPGFAVPVLDAVHAAGHEIAAVYAQPPRPAGRGKRPRPGAVQARAEALGLEVRTPVSLRDPEVRAGLAGLGAEAAVVAAYGLILPRAVLEIFPKGCWNVHRSLLPRWRGAAPVQRAIMAGDARTGVCIMRMEAGLDTGPVALRAAVPIGPGDTAGDLAGRLAELGAGLMVAALARLAAGDLPVEAQPEAGVTYADKIDKAEAEVDWTLPAETVDRRIRGLSPAPGAWTRIGGARVKLLASRVEPGAGAPGTALDDALCVACGTGAVRLLRVQREGRAAAPAAEVLRGFPVPAGARLG